MEAFLLQYEPWMRLGAFAFVLAGMALWEVLAPRRETAYSRRLRWTGNLGVAVFNTVVMRIVLPVTAIGLAHVAHERGWGLLNQFDLPSVLAVAAGVVLLDLVIYGQHVLFHTVPALWRLHRMHHSDLHFDVTTGIRFHPIEIVISAGIKLGAVVVLGPAAVAVLLFEVLLNASSMFNHGNVRLPGRLDRLLRWVLVTPDMHRVHHSVRYEESSSNFGFNLPWWDRLFGTYRAAPRDGHEGMTIGVNAFRSARELRLAAMLVQPFRDAPGQYPMLRRPRPGPSM